MKRKTRSLLEELNDVAVKRDNNALIESRAAHVINSAINLIQLIKEQYDTESAYELERRLLNAIKGADPAKFTRSIRKLRIADESIKGVEVTENQIENN